MADEGLGEGAALAVAPSQAHNPEAKRILSGLAALTPEQMAVLYGVVVNRASYRVIAAECGVPHSAVPNLLASARAALIDRLENVVGA
jgi:DNA-directed RNA polymerase specialized sigma24 family protein